MVILYFFNLPDCKIVFSAGNIINIMNATRHCLDKSLEEFVCGESQINPPMLILSHMYSLCINNSHQQYLKYLQLERTCIPKPFKVPTFFIRDVSLSVSKQSYRKHTLTTLWWPRHCLISFTSCENINDHKSSLGIYSHNIACLILPPPSLRFAFHSFIRDYAQCALCRGHIKCFDKTLLGRATARATNNKTAPSWKWTYEQSIWKSFPNAIFPKCHEHGAL